MEQRILLSEQIEAYSRWLRSEERSSATVEKYLRDIRRFAAWQGGRSVTRESVSEWKEYLLAGHKSAATVNAALSALNSLFRFLDWDNCRARFLKIQKSAFCDPARELTRDDYNKLVSTARRQGNEKLALLLETICATGIRVSELRYITVEAARLGRAEIRLKGKIRAILLPDKLCRKLLKYAKKAKNASGEIFLSRSGRPINRRQIWADMKALCTWAGVEPGRVFPHNLRHLFASTFYRATRDISKLADILGHSSVETTRIYLKTSGAEHRRQLEQLGLVL